MKQKSIAILCALALIVGGLGQAYATESDEPLLPAGVGLPWEAGQEAPPAAATEPSAETEPPSETDEPLLPAEATDTPEPVETPTAEGETPPEVSEPLGEVVHIGLAYGDNALAGANLANDVGSGYRFGYTDENRKFWQVGYTSETALSVVKTQNVYYGYNYGSASNPLLTYSDTVSSDVLVGCWHVQLPGAFDTFEEAQTYAWDVGGFPAWINGEYQVRFGSYATQGEAQTMAEQLGGTAVGTSAYGVSAVKTKTNTILFQFDGGAQNSLTVKPGTDDTQKTVTHYRGGRYYGSFQFRRLGGGNMTVTNYLPMNDYLSCVISQEMSASWPLEALKAQAVTARTYYERNRGSKHKEYGFDLCSTTNCQAYPGMSRTTERTVQAVEETDGLRVWYDGKLAETYYFASDGGGTEDVRNVWGAKDLPYLCGVIDPYEETVVDKIPYWDYQKTFTASELNAIVQPYIQEHAGNCADIVDFQVTGLSPTGNVKSIAFTDSNGKVWPFTMTGANKFRGLLGLQSIRYTVTKAGTNAAAGVYYLDDGGTLSTMDGVYAIDGKGRKAKLNGNPYVITASGTQFLQSSTSDTPMDDEAVYTITSRGYGHNVGMSQWGAYAMAQQGMTFEDILTFYYPGVEIY